MPTTGSRRGCRVGDGAWQKAGPSGAQQNGRLSPPSPIPFPPSSPPQIPLTESVSSQVQACLGNFPLQVKSKAQGVTSQNYLEQVPSLWAS